MKCPDQLADEMSASKERLGKAVSCGCERAADSGRGNGADDEGTGSHFEGGCGEVEVVGSGRDYGRDGPHDAALARATKRARLQRVMGLPET